MLRVRSAGTMLNEGVHELEARLQLILSDEALDKALPLMRGEMGKLTNLYARAGYKKQIARSLVRRAIENLREHQHG